MATEPTLKIRMFGTFGVWIGEERLHVLHRREGDRILAYLVLKAGEPISYKSLADMFWPAEASGGDGDYGSFPSTRQAVRTLRIALGVHGERLKSIGKGILVFDVANIDVDVLEFDRLVAADEPEGWNKALALHQAPLLEGWSETWVSQARARRERSAARVSGLLSEHTSPTKPIASNEVAEHVPFPTPRTISKSAKAPLGGAVSLDSPYYIRRETDDSFIQAIVDGDSTVLVKGAGHTGKSSLLARGLCAARDTGARFALIDFQTLNESQFESAETLLPAIASSIALQLDIDFDVQREWNAYLGPCINLEQVLRRRILGSFDQRLVLGMDNVDRLFKYPYAGEIFGLMRSWHNRRAMDPEGPWSRLTLALCYATEVALFITDMQQSPFNVGTQVSVTDFSEKEFAALNAMYASPVRSHTEIEALYALLHGHPYLSQIALNELANESADLSTISDRLLRDDGILVGHLRKLDALLSESPDCAETVARILKGQQPVNRASFYRLRAVGLIKGDWTGVVSIRCPIYETFFRKTIDTGS